MKFGRNVLQVNVHRLESDFRFNAIISRWRPRRHFTPEKCRRLASKHEASVRVHTYAAAYASS